MRLDIEVIENRILVTELRMPQPNRYWTFPSLKEAFAFLLKEFDDKNPDFTEEKNTIHTK